MNTALPLGWSWSSIADILRGPLRNGHSIKSAAQGTQVRCLTLTAVTTGDFSEANTKLVATDPDEVADLWAEPGDILIERGNTPELVGLARMYRGPRGFAILPDLLIRARVAESVAPRYVEMVL